MRRYISLLPLLMIVFAVNVLTPRVAEAQPGAPSFCDLTGVPNVVWTRCYDFRFSDWDFTTSTHPSAPSYPRGQYIPGVGFKSLIAPQNPPTSSVWQHVINLDPPPGWTATNFLRHIKVIYEWTPDTDVNRTDWMHLTSDGNVTSFSRSRDQMIAGGGTLSANVTMVMSVGGFDLNIISDQCAPCFTPSAAVNIDITLVALVLGGDGTPPAPPPVYIREFPRPLEIDHVNSTYDWFDTNGIPDPVGTHCERVDDALNVITGYTDCNQINRIALNHVPHTAVQTSNVIDAPVHAVLGGYVLERRTLLPYECYDMTIYDAGPPYDGSGCLLEIPNWVTANNRALFIQSIANPIYLVRVQHDDDTEMRYLLTNPRVTAGQDISTACVLGETIPTGAYTSISALRSMFTSHYLDALPDASPPPIWNLFADIIDTGGASPAGVVVLGYLRESEEDVEFLGPPFSNYSQIDLVDYSPKANSCDTTANFSDCVSINPQFFNEGEYWLNGNSSVPALWTNPGVILEPGGRVVLPNLPLDTATAYGASAQVEQLVENTFSNGRIRISIGQSVYTQSVFGTISTVRIESQTHTATTGILYDIAIENTGENDLKVRNFCLTEGDSDVITNCLFTNRSFDMGLDGWTTSGGVVSTSQPGAIELEHGESISQLIPLWANDDSSPHTYTIEIEARIPTSTGGQIVMSWDGMSTTAITVIPLIGFETTATYTRELTVSAADIQDFTITVYIPNQVDTPVAGAVTIFRVCILGPYPDLAGGGGVIDQPEGCGVIPYPSSPDVQEVLQWHWYQIDRFNRCTFIPRLNDVFKAILKGFDQLNEQFKFWRQVLYSFSGWMETKLFPWLAGYLSNIMPGTIIVEGGGECNDLFCFLTSLIDSVIGPIVRLFTDLIQQAANLLFSVISGLLSVFITLIGQAFTLLQVVLQVFFGLIQQFIEAEPIPLPGMPDCGATPTEGICVIWWVADNTIFSGPGAAIIPLLVSILYIEYALWVIAEIKAIIVRSAEAL